jgi:putative membrane protein
MKTIALILTAFVALEHVYFMILEMVLWKSQGPKVFKITRRFAKEAASLASNQGLYNGFLVAALLLGLFLPDPTLAHAFRLYGLICVAAAGVWGGITVNPRIFLVQSVPALAALALTAN